MSSPYQTKSRVVLYVFCEDCGKECYPCDYCEKRVSRGPSEYCADCYRDFGYAGQMFYHKDPSVKASFVCSSCEEKRADPKALREGFVSLSEIMNGQHVTGEQFFNAIREAEDAEMDDEVSYVPNDGASFGHPNFPLEGESYVGNNPKTMSMRQLHAAMDEVDEDRKQLRRRNRNRFWSPEDEDLMDVMNEWAGKVFEEIRTRCSSRA